MKWVVFEWPKWGSYQCDVPSFCKVWNLMLASSAHLTRTSHHNDQVNIFSTAQAAFNNGLKENGFYNPEQINENGNMHFQPKIVTWGGWEKKMEMSYESSKFISICPRWNNHFWLDWDLFIHETLLSCPMCD